MLTNKEIADVQSAQDFRNMAVQKVGIKALKLPVIVTDHNFQGSDFDCPTTSSFDMFVDLPPDYKGTHMSRFVELLHESQPLSLSVQKLPSILDAMLNRFQASSAFFEAKFPFFLEKVAPVSKVKSYLDYDVTLKAKIENSEINIGVLLTVPIATLCPCSKEIAQYGAHNQRSHVTLEAWTKDPTFYITPLIKMIEAQASCELYGTLKRLDEKFLTEKAYENPKFVEDLVRDVAIELNKSFKFSYYRVASENFESIHNHSAYAEIVFP